MVAFTTSKSAKYLVPIIDNTFAAHGFLDTVKTGEGQSSIPNVHEVRRHKNKCNNTRRLRNQGIGRKLYESTRQNLTLHPY